MSLTSTTNQFTEKAVSAHGNKYDYSKVEYISAHKKVKIICPIHGAFFQTPSDHYNGGYGCNFCGYDAVALKRKLSLHTFIERANHVHNDKYDYSIVDYTNNHTKIKISCSNHGIFEQTPMAHLQGQGCRKCSKYISKLETKWLDSLNVYNRQITIKTKEKWMKVDGYDPKTNTVFEFLGDYWHGNPKIYNKNDINPTTKTSYGKLYNHHLKRRQRLIDSGYGLVEMWESDWYEMVR